MVIFVKVRLHEALNAQLLGEIPHFTRFHLRKHIVFVVPVNRNQLGTDYVHCLAVQIKLEFRLRWNIKCLVKAVKSNLKTLLKHRKQISAEHRKLCRRDVAVSADLTVQVLKEIGHFALQRWLAAVDFPVFIKIVILLALDHLNVI